VYTFKHVLGQEAAFLPGRPMQQRIPANGGWPEGDAVFSGSNPAGGAVITYYQRTRHLFGPIKLEILDSEGKVIDTISASKRRGINRVAWSMSVKPPRVPRAAQLAFNASQGPRVPPGNYTVRLTKGSQSIQTQIQIQVDRRASYSAADRAEQFRAVMQAHALFNKMSDLVDRLDATSRGAMARAQGLASDPLGKKLQAVADRIAVLKRQIVATKEGGMITGEERIREHLDTAYGALMSSEGKPARYQVEYVEVLGRELSDVSKEFDALEAGDIAALDKELAGKKLEPIAAHP